MYGNGMLLVKDSRFPMTLGSAESHRSPGDPSSYQHVRPAECLDLDSVYRTKLNFTQQLCMVASEGLDDNPSVVYLYSLSCIAKKSSIGEYLVHFHAKLFCCNWLCLLTEDAALMYKTA